MDLYSARQDQTDFYTKWDQISRFLCGTKPRKNFALRAGAMWWKLAHSAEGEAIGSGWWQRAFWALQPTHKPWVVWVMADPDYPFSTIPECVCSLQGLKHSYKTWFVSWQLKMAPHCDSTRIYQSIGYTFLPSHVSKYCSVSRPSHSKSAQSITFKTSTHHNFCY
jgi:hypothetical protein